MGAWVRDGWTSIIRAEGYGSDSFTILVGPEQKSFRVHAAFLAQSPVFEISCYGKFKESHEQRIELPDDDPEVASAIIQYLYSGNVLDFGTADEEDGSAKAADQLAELYIAAEKYQLEDLKSLVVQKLERVTDVEQSPLEFLNTAQKIYSSIAEEENVYRLFFGASASLLPRPTRMGKRLREAFDGCLFQGGFLSMDLTAAMSASYEERIKIQTAKLQNEERLVKELRDDNTMAQWKTDGLLMEIADLEKKAEDFTNKYEVAVQQKMGLISRLRSLEQDTGRIMACRDHGDHDFEADE
ncbi:MAG: hypothetical protein Q9208_005169 [Pyrenodesmia sp. 3 TL-2023]